MRVLGWIVIIILLVILYFQLVGSKYESPTPDNLELVRGTESKRLVRDEPKILDAYINEAGVLYAAVINDGTSRDGFASYLCQLYLNKPQLVSRVKVVEYGSSKSPKRDNAYGTLLGESYCR